MNGALSPKVFLCRTNFIDNTDEDAFRQWAVVADSYEADKGKFVASSANQSKCLARHRQDRQHHPDALSNDAEPAQVLRVLSQPTRVDRVRYWEAMVSRTAQAPGRVTLALTESADGRLDYATWIGKLVELGIRTSDFSKELPDQQLIVAVSVPARYFAAPLIGCGWMSNSPAPTLADPLAAIGDLATGTPIRAVTTNKVIVDFFEAIDFTHTPARLRLSSRQWQVDKVLALTALEELDAYCEQPTPQAGSISNFTRISRTWAARLCKPPQDLALVGTLKWLREDLSGFLSTDDDSYGEPEQISSFLQVGSYPDATWSTRLFSPTSVIDSASLPSELKAVVLDGASAIKLLADVETPVVFAVIDRSVADETSSEILLHIRSSRGSPVSVSSDIGWVVPRGIEALAFTVPL